MKYLIVLVLLLSGCGYESKPWDSLQWDGSYKAQSDIGIYVNIEEDTTADYWTPIQLAAVVDELWMGMQECSSIYQDPDRPFSINLIEHGNQVIPSSGLISLLNPDYVYSEVVYNPREKRTKGAISHEMIHYLLHMDGLPYDDNYNHNSDLFDKCP